MKKIILLAFLAISLSSQAQIGNLLKKVKTGSEKVGKAVDVVTDSGVTGGNANKGNTNSGNANSGNTNSSNANSSNANSASVKTSNANVGSVKGGSSGQLNLFEEQKLAYAQYQNHIGQVCFSNNDFERTLPESQYLKSFKLGDKLSLRAWFANSPANSAMLQLEKNGMSPSEINQGRDKYASKTTMDLVLYFDGKIIDRTLTDQTDKEEDITTLPTFRLELNDNTANNWVGEDMYAKLLKRTDLLSAGTHKLKIEVLPRILGYGTGANFPPKAIAVGEIDMIVPFQKATEENCFPEREKTDPVLENEVIKAVKKSNPNAYKVILNSSFRINKNDYGIIISKSFKATVVSKTAERVWYDSYVFDKVYDGSKYGDAFISKDTENFILPKDRTVQKDCLQFLK
jgi:hypothetical protein